MKRIKNRVTYEELFPDFSHYEISCLAMFKAMDIIKSGRSLIGQTPYNLKVALVALDEICANKEDALQYREVLKERLFNIVEEAEDEYSIDGLSDDEGE